MSESENKTPRAKERYLEISGEDQYGRSKAHVVLTYLNQYSDGTSTEIQTLTISRKPIVNIFRHADYVSVTLDFGSARDVDLAMAWQLLEEYSRPINSVDWLPEELESGIFLNEAGEECLVFFPMIQLGLIPINHENEFGIAGMNPLMYTLRPNSPTSGDACVLQLTFKEGWFHVTETEAIEPLNIEQIREEVAQEQALAMIGNQADPGQQE